MSDPKVIAIDDQEPFDLDSPEAIRQMNIRQARLGRLAQEIALAGLLELKVKLTRGEALNMSYEDAEKLRGAGVEMELAALGRRQRDAGDDAPIPPPGKPN